MKHRLTIFDLALITRYGSPTLLTMMFVLGCTGRTAKSAEDSWTFSWDRRMDRNGKPAGIYDITPYPIDEHTVEYTIMNDEGSTTYHLGQKIFVDGARPNDLGNGRTLKAAKKTIVAAIRADGPGNRTIIIRGAHNRFNGIYYESRLKPFPGVDNTRRWIMVGYKQERPIIDAGNGDRHIILGSHQPEGFITIQRVKLQNSKRGGVWLGRTDRKVESHYYLVDVWIYNCINVSKGADAGVYYLNVDHGYIRHCTVERSKGHGFKIGDGSSDFIMEWCVAEGAGWYPKWDGPKHYYGTHPTALDFPNDAAGSAARVTCRYSIGKNAFFYGVQLRRIMSFSFHRNEIFNTLHFDDIRDADNHSIGRHQVIIFAGNTSGQFHSNVIHQPGSSRTDGIYVSTCTDAAAEIAIYNNVIYGKHKYAIRIHPSNRCKILIANNNLHAKDTPALIVSGIGDRLNVVNNILYVSGRGQCLSIGSGRHSYNFFKGMRGVQLGTGEKDGFPGWKVIPDAPFAWQMFRLRHSFPGTNLSKRFRKDANGVLRGKWDRGAFEWNGSSVNTGMARKHNAR